MITFIGFCGLLVCLLISVPLFLSLAFLIVPTLVIFLVLYLLGISIAFWKLYLIVFLVVFVVNLLKD